MPVTLQQLNAKMQQIGTLPVSAAISKPYSPDPHFGYVHTTYNDCTAFLAAMVVAHEGTDLTFEEVTDVEVVDARQGANAAVEALRAAQTGAAAAPGGNDVQTLSATNVQAQALLKRITHRHTIRENLVPFRAIGAYIELVGAQQIKGMQMSNVIAYFQHCGLKKGDVPDVSLNFIDYFSRFNPGIAGSPKFTIRVENSKWLQCRLAVSQSGPLVMRAHNSAPIAANGTPYFTEIEIAAAQAHVDEPWNMTLARAIPSSALMKAALALESIGAAPKNEWYMGTKAKALYPSRMIKTLQTALKAYQTSSKRQMHSTQDNKRLKI